MFKTCISQKRDRVLGHALIILLCILLNLLGLWHLGSNYERQWLAYPNDQYQFYLRNIPFSQNEVVTNQLTELAKEQNLFISQVDDNDQLIRIGVVGQPQKSDRFEFAKRTLVSVSDLTKLLHSENEYSTIGSANGSVNQIATIPVLPFSRSVSIMKMAALVNKRQTVNGTYVITGVKNQTQFRAVINQIARAIQQNPSELTTIKSGKATDIVILVLALQIFIIVIFVLLIAYFAVLLLRQRKNFGTLIILGWSKSSLLFNELLPFVFVGLLTAVILSLAFPAIFLQQIFSLEVITQFILRGCQSLLLVIWTYLLATFTILVLSDVELIKGKLPKKLLYSFAILLYGIISVGLVAGAYSIDGPVKSIAANAHQAQQWEKVSNYEILGSITPGEDGIHAYTDSGAPLNRDIYSLYKKLAYQPGVYYSASFYGSATWLTDMKNNQVYHNLPPRPFWILTLSPNYLSEIGINISKQAKRDALAGKKVYLLPVDLNTTKVQSFLKEYSQESLSKADIQTSFVRNRQFSFLTYNSRKPVFTWNEMVNDPSRAKAPIIEVITPANMTFMDIGGLLAPGLQGSLKFKNAQIAKKFVTAKTLAEHHLTDNKLSFLPVREYIDGLQKSLWQTVTWFSSILGIALIILIFVLLGLVVIFQVINQEELAVKRMLGFSIMQSYRLPMLLITSSFVLELIFCLVVHSKIAVVAVIIAAILQLVALQIFVKHNESKKIVRILKEG